MSDTCNKCGGFLCFGNCAIVRYLDGSFELIHVDLELNPCYLKNSMGFKDYTIQYIDEETGELVEKHMNAGS